MINWNGAWDWVFPRWCVRCEAPAWGEDMPLGACWACALSWPDVRGPAGHVLFADRVYGLRGALGFRLRGAPELHPLVHRIKYGGDRWLAERAGRWLAAGNDPPGTVLVPVPLHWRRKARRGYNQAELIARGAGRHWHLPVARDALLRRQHQASLTGSNRTTRQQTLGATYEARPPTGPHRAVLVDDVLTTGATLRACATALEAKGWQVTGAAVLALA